MYITMRTFLSFLARKSKTELKVATKTWDVLKATYLIALLYISNENTSYLFEISRYIKYFETRTCYGALMGYIRLAIALKRGRAPPFYYVLWIPS